MAKRKLLLTILVCLVLVGIVPLLALGFFNHPSADDFSYTQMFMRPTVLEGGNLFDVLSAAAETSKHFYNTWQGLYSSAFVLALQPAIFGEKWYCLTTVILLVMILTGFFVLYYAICRHVLGSTSKSWLWIGIVSLLVFTQTLPSPVEGLYWYNGAMNYMFFWSILCIMIGAIIIFLYSSGIKSYIFLILSCCSAFVLAGGNHVTTVCGIVILAAITMVQLHRKSKLWIIAPLLICIIGLCFVMSAPGTAIRAEALGTDSVGLKSLMRIVGMSVYTCVQLAGRWIDLSYLCFIIAIIPFAVLVCKHMKKDTRVSVKLCWMLPILGCVTMVAMLCPPFYAMGSMGAGRLVNAIYATFLVFTGMEIIAVVSVIKCRSLKGSAFGGNSYSKINGMLSSISFDLNRGLATSCIAIFILLFSFGSLFNFHEPTWVEAVRELAYGVAPRYDRTMDERTELYLDEEIKDVVVDPLDEKPVLLFFDDITTDETDWRNADLAKYYNKNTVKLNEE